MEDHDLNVTNCWGGSLSSPTKEDGGSHCLRESSVWHGLYQLRPPTALVGCWPFERAPEQRHKAAWDCADQPLLDPVDPVSLLAIQSEFGTKKHQEVCGKKSEAS